MRKKAVNIGVDPATGAITYIKPVTHAKKRETIEWASNDPFAIQFTGVTPVQFQRRRSRYVRASRKHKLTGVVKGTAEEGAYPYACAVFAEGIVYLDARCPVIIIDI